MSAVQDLKETVSRLRGPGGCPWDIEQTHETICDCMIEELSELLDAIDRKDFPHMREELGDLLLHVIFHSQMAKEAGHFDFEDVAREINEKLIRRHPHVFGDGKLTSSEEVLKQWDVLKSKEKKNDPVEEGPFKRLPPRLPALLYARDVYKQLVKKELDPKHLHVDSDQARMRGKELTEVRAGRELFELVAACREAGIDPESALRRYTTGIVEGIRNSTVA